MSDQPIKAAALRSLVTHKPGADDVTGLVETFVREEIKRGLPSVIEEQIKPHREAAEAAKRAQEEAESESHRLTAALAKAQESLQAELTARARAEGALEGERAATTAANSALMVERSARARLEDILAARGEASAGGEFEFVPVDVEPVRNRLGTATRYKIRQAKDS